MKVFIVSVPLFDARMAVQAYRLRDRSGETTMGLASGDFRRVSESLLSPGLDLIEQMGVEPFALDKPLFVNANALQLLTGFPLHIDLEPRRLVCTLPGDTNITANLLSRCRMLKERGYLIALDGFPPDGLASRLLPLADYIILNCQDSYFDTWYRLAEKLGSVRVVVDAVPDRATFDRLSVGSNALFSGDFYNRPITAGTSRLSPVKMNALQLLNMVNTEDFELQDIARIIERDPYLTISLLRFINNGPLRRRNKVESIMSAVAILGQREVRRWATVAISVGLAEDRPGEITKLSLVRAKFAENLARAFGLGVFSHHLFMVGLFSLLDIILEKPMAEALAEVAVDNRVRQALLDRTGELAQVMELIYVYERADWDAVSFMLIRAGVTVDQLSAAFVDAMGWYHDLLHSIDEEEAAAEADHPAVSAGAK
jgi:c-di-GMP-related signal transduction protein